MDAAFAVDPDPPNISSTVMPSSVVDSMILLKSSKGFWLGYFTLSDEVRPTMSIFHTSFMFTIV